MKWEEYQLEFDQILSGEFTDSPYDNASYVEYVKLNNSRSKRWIKKGELTDEIKSKLDSVQAKQKWILITEPWCGDAAHLTPFIKMMADYSPNIELEIQKRDGEQSEIDNYLTNGGKSIPKLIVRDENGTDLYNWGPRPTEPQAIVMNQKSSNQTAEEKKSELQVWYNKDKGISIQKELADLI
ncbi:MAG: hypothetical protein ACJASQ_000174 [Crocinitomicaceae bacterium]|jgi:hypothetical protein